MLRSPRTLLTLAASAAMLALSASAHGAITVDRFDVTSTSSQAGAHPDLRIDVETAREAVPYPSNTVSSPLQRMRDLRIDLPAGIVGDPTAVPRCRTAEFVSLFSCPHGAQIGLVTIDAGQQFEGAVWLLEPSRPDETARLGIRAGGLINTTISVRPRSEGDFGLRSEALAIPHALYGVARLRITLWGDPASPSHDLDRINGYNMGACGSDPLLGTRLPCPHPASSTAGAFLSNPSGCGPLAPARLRLDSWEEPGQYAERESALPPITGCEHVPFAPSVTVTPDDRRPDTPSGYTVKVEVPQNDAPSGLASSHVRKVDLTLPPGVVISPAGADGLQTCSDDGLRLGQDAPADCPGGSSIATAKIDVPLLAEPLEGEVYLRPPEPGHLFRLAIVADGPGIHLKILGEATPDPVTGQLRAVFDDTPQQPFSALELHFDGGPHGALANPQSCGTGAASGTVLGWNGVVKPVSSDVTIDQGCAPRGFAPAVAAGTTGTAAGQTSGFVLNVRRSDGEQGLRAIDAQLPAGVSAVVKSVPLCSDADAAAATCPAASRVGSATAGAGSGPAPLFLSGSAYLTAGYGGAPYGMSFVVPAKVGPFDLGNVVVRARVFVDRSTAALRVVSEPLPEIVQGVPLRLRELRIAVDRPGFIVNPTSCAAKTVRVTTSAIEGATSTASVPFAATGCKALPFTPVVRAETSGKRWKGSGASLKVSITQPAAQANLAQVSVKLPSGLAARGTTIRNACTAEQWSAGACPAKTRAGTAKATTPILGEPLTAGVYFVSRPKGQSGLPQLRMVLRGAGLEVELAGDVVVEKDGTTRTTFAGVPDVPITAFEMNLPQGPNSLLEANRVLCSAGALPLRTDLRGQNGARRVRSVAVRISGCKSAKKAGRKVAARAGSLPARAEPAARRGRDGRDTRSAHGTHPATRG